MKDAIYDWVDEVSDTLSERPAAWSLATLVLFIMFGFAHGPEGVAVLGTLMLISALAGKAVAEHRKIEEERDI